MTLTTSRLGSVFLAFGLVALACGGGSSGAPSDQKSGLSYGANCYVGQACDQGTCINDAEFGSFCTDTCDDNDDCPQVGGEQWTCHKTTKGSPGLCRYACTSDYGSLTCKDGSLSSCEVSPCEEGQVCMADRGCVAVAGGACESDYECESKHCRENGTCGDPIGASCTAETCDDCYAFEEVPGKTFCSSSCDYGSDCPTGTICLGSPVTGNYECLPSCFDGCPNCMSDEKIDYVTGEIESWSWCELSWTPVEPAGTGGTGTGGNGTGGGTGGSGVGTGGAGGEAP